MIKGTAEVLKALDVEFPDPNDNHAKFNRMFLVNMRKVPTCSQP
jgi:hypothetical protein